MLATITGLTGTGARAVGTHMAVLESGESAGSFSSGCVEAAIVAEAKSVLEAGAPRSVRFGQGSPYIDIRLPCGGGMDVLFLPDLPVDVIEGAAAHFSARTPFVLRMDEVGSAILESGVGAAAEGKGFSVRHAPPLKLVLLGHGAEMLAGLRLARAMGAEVEIVSPETEIVAAAIEAGVPAFQLISPSTAFPLHGDPWTAFLFLFHDHDWEPLLLAAALAEPSLWIGAMGSRSTQEARRAALLAASVPEADVARVRGPVGLIPSSRDPATLALSALAEIVDAYSRGRA